MLKRVWSLIIKEFLASWRDPRSRILIIVPPLIQLIIFANAATMEVKNISMAVVDHSQTPESRELIASFAYSRWFKEVKSENREETLAQALSAQKIQLGLLIPGDFATRLKKGEPGTLQVIVDGRQTNSAAIISGYASEIIDAYRRQFSQPSQKLSGLQLEIRNWYNPNLSFRWYTVTSLIAILASIVGLLLTALSVARERELGTFEQLIVSPLSSFEILLGKTLPPLLIAMVLASLLGLCGIWIFDVPFTGSLLCFLSSTFVFLLSIVGVGLFISSVSKTQQQAILGAFSFLMPAILLSGFVSPIADMPPFFQNLTLFNPVRYYLVIVKGLFLKAMPAQDVWHNVFPLLVIALVTLSLAAWTFKRKLE